MSARVLAFPMPEEQTPEPLPVPEPIKEWEGLPFVSVANIIACAPEGAKAIIIAELEQDCSDAQSDYFGSRTVSPVIVLGFRMTARESFPALRKAAASWPATAHMGPGRDKYRVRIVFATSFEDHGRYHHAGDYAFIHADLLRDENGKDCDRFETQAEAEAFIAAKGEPHAIHYGETEVTFRWKIEHSSYEHRENYSMGGGNYLAADRYHGWKVSSTPLEWRSSGKVRITPAALKQLRKRT